MKNRPDLITEALVRRILSVSIGALCAAAPARAADVTWTNGAGNLLWNTSSPNFSTGAWNNARFDGAIFGPVGVGAVNLAAPITVSSLNFTAGGYTLGGSNALTFSRAGTSTLGARTISVETGAATIDASIVSTVGLEIRGAGTLTLGGSANSFTGAVPVASSGRTVNLQIGSATTTTGGGNLTLASAAALPASTVVGIGSGVLDIGATSPTIAGLIFANTRGGGASTGQVVGTTGTLTVAGEIQVIGNATGFGNQIAAPVNLAAGTQIVRVGNGVNGASELIFGNVISGSGGLTKTFFLDAIGQSSLGGFSMRGNNTYTGPTIISGSAANIVTGSNASTALTVGNGTLALLGANGAFASAATVNLTPGSNLFLDNANGLNARPGLTSAVVAGNLSNRLSSTAALSLLGGGFQIIGAANAASSQQVASVALSGGFNALTLAPGAGGTSLFSTTGNLTLAAGATVLFRAPTLPLTTATTQGTTAFTIAGTRPTPVGAAGIIVGAIGDASVGGNGSGFVRYNATGNAGIALLAPGEYTPNFTTAGANVDVTAAQTVGVGITVNAIRTGAFTTTLNAPVTVTTGMILATGAGTFSGASALDFAGNRGFLLGGGLLTVDTPLTGLAGLTKGPGTVTISGSTAGLSGGVVVQSGTLNFTTNSAATAFAGTLEIQRGTANFAVADSGTGAVVLGSTAAAAESAVAPATLGLSDAAVTTFARPINVLGNGGADRFGLTINTSIAATTQTLTGPISLGNNLTISGGTAGSVLNVNGAITGSSGLFVNYTGGTLNLPNPASGYGGDLFLTGTGTVNLAGSANAGAGGVTQVAGTLRVAAAGNFGAGAIKLRGGTLQLDASLTLNRTFSIGADHTVATGANDAVFSGALNGAQGTVTKTGGGTLSLTGVGDFAGNFTLGSGAGALLVNGGGRLPNLGTVALGAGAFFQVDNSTANLSGRTGATTNVAFDSAGVTGGATAQLTTNAAADTFTLGTVSLAGGTAANPHTSTLQITDGNAGNHTITFLGLTAIPANNSLAVTGTQNLGKLTAGGSRIFFTTPPPTNPNGTIANLAFTGFGGSNALAEYDPALGLIAFTTTSTPNIDNVVAGTPTTANFVTAGATTANTGATIKSLTLAGHTVSIFATYPAQVDNGNAPQDTLILSSGRLLATATSTVTSSAATKLRFGPTGTAPALVDVSSGATLTLAANVAPTTTGGLTKTGPGTLVLAGSSQINGDFAVADGTLTISHATALGDAAAGTTVASGATLAVQGGITVSEAITLNGTGSSDGGALRNVSEFNAIDGQITLGSATRINSDAAQLTLLGGVTGTNTDLTVGGAGITQIASAVTTGTGTVTKDGAGVLGLSRTNTYTGATTVNAGTLDVTGSVDSTLLVVNTGGTLQVDGASLADTALVSLSGTGTLALTGAETIGSLVSASATSTVTLNAFTLTTGGDQNSTVFAGAISGTGGLTKQGSGTLVLTGANTYTGMTAVNAGMLAVTGPGTLAASTVSIDGGTLSADSDALGAGVTVVVFGTSTFTTSGTDSFTAIDQAGGTVNGTGVLTLSGGFTQAGGTTGGSVDINSAGFTQFGEATIAAGTSVTSSGPQTLLGGTIAGTLDGTGAVTISTGTTTLAGAGSILNAAVSVANGATLAIRPGTNGTTNIFNSQLTLGATSTFTMADGAANTLNVGGTTFAGGASTLVFEVGGTTSAAADRIVPSGGGASITSPGGKITIQGFGTVANATGSYSLLSGGPNTSLLTNPLTLASSRVAIGGKAYPLTLTTTNSSLTLNVGAAAGADQAFWKGDVSGSWTTSNAGNTNFATTATGLTDLGALPGALTDVFFSARGAGNLTTDPNGTEVNSVTFLAGTAPVTIGGDAGLGLRAAGVGNLGFKVAGGTAAHLVSSPVILGSDQTWANNGTFGVTTLTVTGAVLSSAGARQLTIAGQGNTTINLDVSSSINAFTKTGPGTLTLAGGSSSAGGVAIQGGVVAISASGNLGSASNAVTLNPGGTLRLGATLTLGFGRNLVVNGTAANPSGLDLTAGTTGTLAPDSALTGGGILRVSTTGVGAASTLSIEAAQPFTGEVEIGAPGKLVGDTFSRRIFSAVSGLIVRLQGAGRLASASSVKVNNGAALQITQGSTVVLNRIAAALTFNNGRFQYDPAGSSQLNDNFGTVTATGLLTLTGGATAGPASGTNLSFGSLIRSGNATVGLQSNTAFGTGSIGGGANAGVSYFFGSLTDVGGSGTTRAIVPWAAATVSANSANFSSLVTYDGNGFRRLAASEVALVASQAQFDALSGAPQNIDVSGTLTINGTKTINALTARNGNPNLVGSGTLALASGAIVNFNGAVINGPTLVLPATGGYFHLGFPLSVQGNSIITGSGGGLTTSALAAGADYQLRFTNTGPNTFTGGLFINGNAQVTFTANNQLGQTAGGLNAGAVTLGGGQLLATPGSFNTITLSNGATARPIVVNEAGGTIGSTSPLGAVVIPGAISGAGQMQFGGALANPVGVVNLTNPGPNTYTGGTLISAGLLQISNANQLGTGPVLLNGGILGATANLTFAAAPTLTASSTIGTDVHTVTLSAGLGGSAGETGTAATSLVLTKNGTGTLDLAGDSSFAGTISATGGRVLIRGALSGVTALTGNLSTFELGIAGGINDSATVSLTTATLATAGFSETVGPLTLGSGVSTFDLGDGASVFRFAASNTQSWTGTLSITNWNGIPAGDGTDHLFFGFDLTGLTAGQLAAITFLNPAGFAPGTYPAQLLATGELVAAIPEPGSAALLFAGLGGLLARGQRRRS